MGFATLLIAAFSASACLESATGPADRGVAGPMRWETFHVDQMRSLQSLAGARFVEVMADSAFLMGFLNSPRGVDVGLLEHAESVVYHIVAGRGTLSTEAEDLSFEPGSILFVRGTVEHRLHSTSEELDAIAVFTLTVPGTSDPDVVVISLEDMVAARESESNVWTPLFETTSMGVGMYMLPKGGHGPDVLTHDFDEFKIVVNGGGRLDLGEGGTEVSPGSVAFIKDDLRHRFRRVSDDLDVLVIWGR